MPVDPNIPLQAGQNIPQFGPNIPQAINDQLGAAKLALFNQQQAGQNALRSLYSDPANLDGAGNLKPEAMRSVAMVDPNTAMGLRQQLTQDQMAQAQLGVARAREGQAVVAEKMRVASEAMSEYQDALKTMTPEQARRVAQTAWTAGRDELTKSGLASPEAISTMPSDFDPNRVGRTLNAWNQAMLTPEQKETQREHAITEAQSEERLTIEQQHEAIEQQKEDRASKAAEKGQWVVLTDPGKTDASGNQVQYRYNATKAQATTLAGEPYTPSGAAKMAASAGGLPASQSEVDYWAAVLKNGGALPPGLARTKQGSDLVRQIMAKVPASGTDPGQFIANHATAKANATSLSNMTKMADAATSFERTARQNFDYALTLAPEGVPTNWGPWLNKWIENGETQAGNADVPAYVTAMLTAANEYAKIMSGSTGAQGSTVDSRREAAELFSPYLSQGQIKAVVAVAEGDMDRRKQSLYGQIGDIQDRLKGGGGNTMPPSGLPSNQAATPPPQASPIPTYSSPEQFKAHPPTGYWRKPDDPPGMVRPP